MELAFAVVTALIFGLCLGSFLNVCIARMPLEESVVTPRSKCPRCQKPIAAYDNIPILSWLILRGRCRQCAEPISARYPAVEALTGIVSAGIALKFGDLGIPWVVFLAFSCAMIVLAFIDFDHRILPDPITLNGIWIGLAVSFVPGVAGEMLTKHRLSYEQCRKDPLGLACSFLGKFGDHDSVRWFVICVLGAILGAGLLWGVGEAFYRIRGIEGLGFGDVKMMGMVGAFLGFPLTLFTIMVGSCLGAIIGVLLIRLGGKGRDYELPYGTFLAFGAVLALLAGNEIIEMYLRWAFPATARL